MDALTSEAALALGPAGDWRLTPADHALVGAKSRANRLGFAVMLLFFRERGRFPQARARSMLGSSPSWPGTSTCPSPIRTCCSRSAPPSARWSVSAPKSAPCSPSARRPSRTRRPSGPGCATMRSPAPTSAGSPRPLRNDVEPSPSSPPTPDRIVRAAIHAHEERFAATVHDRLPPEVRKRLDALLHPTRAGEDGGDVAEPVAGARAVLNFVRGEPGRASVNSIKRELERLAVIRWVALPGGLFDDALPHEVELCRQRVSVQPPSDLRRLPEASRLIWLAAYAHLRGRALTDGLVQLLVETVHAIGARAERRVELKVINEFKKVTGKTNLLYEIASASIERPDDTVRQVVFPIAGEQTLRDLVREWQSGPMYKKSLRTTIRGSYTRHYRHIVPALLDALEFRSNNALHRPVIEALGVVKRHAGSRLWHLPDKEKDSIKGVVRPLWRDAVIDTDAKGRKRVTASRMRSASWRPCASVCAPKRSGWSGPTATATPMRICPPPSPTIAHRTTPLSSCRSTPSASSPLCKARCGTPWPCSTPA